MLGMAGRAIWEPSASNINMENADMILFLRRARYAVFLAALATACAQQSQLTSLNGTWDFALAADAAAADRLAGF